MKVSINNIYSSGIVRVFVNNSTKTNKMLTREPNKNYTKEGYFKRFPEGTNLTSIAFSEYGDDMLWYKIAEANKIDGPSLLETTDVFIPRLK